jgi:hypothetical protein
MADGNDDELEELEIDVMRLCRLAELLGQSEALYFLTMTPFALRRKTVLANAA